MIASETLHALRGKTGDSAFRAQVLGAHHALGPQLSLGWVYPRLERLIGGVPHALSAGYGEIASSGLARLEQPFYRDGALYFTAVYSDGEEVLARVRMGQGGALYLSTNAPRSGGNETRVSLSDPTSASSALFDALLLGGRRVHRAFSQLSGRRLVFGARGYKHR